MTTSGTRRAGRAGSSITPQQNPGRLNKLLAIVHSEAAAIPSGVKTFVKGLADQATLRWLENVTQFDFYDNPEDVRRAADVIAEHFRKN